jgi:primase-polymerase (primpol)-like protein
MSDTATRPRRTKQEIERAEEKPEALPVNWDGIPARLKAVDRWVCWWYKRRQDKGGKWKWTKVPINPRTGRLASSTDPSTWGTFQDARDYYLAHKPDGLGFVLGDGFAGVDLDDCRDPVSGDLTPWATKAVACLDSYTDISPTDGTGVKVFVKGALPPGRRRHGSFEFYDGGRFFTVTGHRLEGTPSDVEERPAQLEQLYRQIFAGKTAPKQTAADAPGRQQRKNAPFAGWKYKPFDFANDADLIARARSAANGSRFSQLWDGDASAYGDDDSRADAALCLMLAFWTRKDRGRTDRLFRMSGLMRPKWDERRGETTYGWMTIDNAIEICTEVHGENTNGTGKHEPGEGEHQPEEKQAPDRPKLTDVGNGKRLAARHGAHLRHNHPWKKWLLWNESRWRVDARALATSRAKETVASLAQWAAEKVAEVSEQIGEATGGKE